MKFFSEERACNFEFSLKKLSTNRSDTVKFGISQVFAEVGVLYCTLYAENRFVSRNNDDAFLIR